MSANAFSKDALDVSLWKASRTALSFVERTLEMRVCRFSGRRARSATARLPWAGDERMRAIPVPYRRGIRSMSAVRGLRDDLQ
jgi:hypothetical protein